MTLVGVHSKTLARIAAAVLVLPMLAHCGGGAGSGPVGPPPIELPTGPNVTAITVDAGVNANQINIPSVSVTICTPGTASCQTINHILLDTASTGLRIMASALSPSVVLPQVRTAAGDPMFECLIFANKDYIWGSVRTADVQIANGKASSLAVQIVSDHNTDASIPVTPTDCSESNLVPPPAGLNSVTSFGSNGVLGISVFQQDCGPACVTIANPGGLGFYYGCPASGCVGTTVSSVAAEVQNPISQLAGNDHNGVLIVLPSLGPAGQGTAIGALALGIDTESNNQLGTATVLGLNPVTGNFTTIYKGQTLSASFLDTGSNVLFFDDTTLPACAAAAFYCPTSAQALSATNHGQGANSTPTTVSFRIVNEASVTTVGANFAAFDDIGGPSSDRNSFDWGLPFYFGRKVFLAFEAQTTSTATGPFVAY